MSESENTDNKFIKFIEDEDIYIECSPVDITGEVITSENDKISDSNDILDSLSDKFGINILDNIGLQTLIAIIILGILYAIGTYVFKGITGDIIDKKKRKYI